MVARSAIPPDPEHAPRSEVGSSVQRSSELLLQCWHVHTGARVPFPAGVAICNKEGITTTSQCGAYHLQVQINVALHVYTTSAGGVTITPAGGVTITDGEGEADALGDALSSGDSAGDCDCDPSEPPATGMSGTSTLTAPLPARTQYPSRSHTFGPCQTGSNRNPLSLLRALATLGRTVESQPQVAEAPCAFITTRVLACRCCQSLTSRPRTPLHLHLRCLPILTQTQS